MRFITKLAAVCLLSFSLGWTLEANAAQVTPTPTSDVARSGTATGSPVTVLQDGTSVAGYRTDCHLQNNGANVMYYSFTGTATTSSFQLQPGESMYCSNGNTTSSTALSVLGTAADVYSLTEQFVRAQ